MSARHLPLVIEPVPVGDVTHAGDFFLCTNYALKLSAGQCGKRREQANTQLTAKKRWMSGQGTLDRGKCKSCATGERVAANVAAGPTRLIKAARRGSARIPERTRRLLAWAIEDCGLRAVARKVRLAPGTVKRAAEVGQIRAKSFRALRKLIVESAEEAAQRAAA